MKVGVALKNFFRVAEHWQLMSQEQAWLLGVSLSKLARLRKRIRSSAAHRRHWWKYSYAGSEIYRSRHQRDLDKNQSLSDQELERILWLVWIDKDLRALLPYGETAAHWVRMPRSYPFRSESALEVMIRGTKDDFQLVRHFLHSRCW